MSDRRPAADPEYFDRLYAASDDPWGLEDRFYEQRKRDLVLAALPRERFFRAFEPGCAIGLLTERLAQRCDRIVAWDGSARAVSLARGRLARVGTVTVERARIPEEWPEGPFDLVVLSEVGYYCEDLKRLNRSVVGSLSGDGVLLACHWRHPAADHPHRAETVHAAVGTGLHRLVAHAEDDFLLDVWGRDPRSVACRTGVVA